MDMREFSGDYILIFILVVSTLVFVTRFWSDPVTVTSAALIMLSLGGLFLWLHRKIRVIERSMQTRERMLRANMEEIAVKMAQKYDTTITHLDGVVDEFAKRAYR